MSLADDLNDINGNISEPDNTLISLESNNSNGNIDINVTRFKVSINALNKETVSKFNELFSKITIKRSIQGLQKLDCKIAQEVFTMLPDLGKTEQAKITSNPSVINKDVVDNALKNVDDKIPEDIITTLRDIRTQIDDNKNCIEEVVNAVNSFKEICSNRVKTLNESKPLVIYNKETYNLLTDKIGNISWIDDTQIEYKKYIGQMRNRYNELMNDETIHKYIEYTKINNESPMTTFISDLSLLDLYENISLTYNKTNAAKSFLEDFRTKITVITDSLDVTVNNETYEVVNRIPTAIDALKYLQMLHGIVETNDNFFTKIQSLLEFID